MNDQLLPFSGEDGAVAYFGSKIGPHIANVRRAVRCAERRLVSLRDLYDDPHAVAWHVEMELAEFLVWATQVRVSINDAVRAAGDDQVSAWWDALLGADSELEQFTKRRHRALKRMEPASER